MLHAIPVKTERRLYAFNGMQYS